MAVNHRKREKAQTKPRQTLNRAKTPGRRRGSAASDGKRHNRFPIVGVGASAGGLEALERFLSHMPADSGLAIILVTHLAPSHVSMLPELLKRQTKVDVVQAEDGMKVKPNRVHIIPPNTDMAIMNGTLLLKPPTEARGLRLPIDHFFRSLAEDQREQAICVILSGNGTDGTLGLKAIKAELGMAMAQDIATAKYDGMPRSAIETGLVDYILPPEKMAEQLMRYANHAAGPSKVPAISEILPPSLQKIFLILRSQTGHDFSQYKKNTICRRIERRMHVHQVDNINNYVRYLQQTPREADILFKELLIGVTSFFRDAEAFQVLKEYLMKSLKERPKDYGIRVWVPACSGGEEAYSLAILIRECLDELNRTFKVQIFGTDLDQDSIQNARSGLYPASIAGDMSPERLKRYFIKEDNAYRISKDIREMVVFAFQDVIKDPPFTKLDLLSCRNLLIYLDGDLQKRLLPIFQYALRPNGLLFLGTSESVGSFVELFSLVDKKWKIFRRKEASFSTQAAVGFPSTVAPSTLPEEQSRKDREVKIVSVAEHLLLDRYAPPCVLINPEGLILYTHGRTGKYLELAPGQSRLHVLEMAREGLKHELAAGIRKANATQNPLSLKNLQVKTNGAFERTNVILRPVVRRAAGEPLLMIVFEDQEQQSKGTQTKTASRTKPDSRVALLEQDLKSTQESLQTTIEELETSNEELKSTNEELQSTNEELQSTNEELETSKEELQSLNEELVTVNTELQGKIDELSLASNDMKNLLDSTKIATIFLDSQLHVKRFTPEAKRIVNLIQSDVGRPIADISPNLEDISLVDDAQKVLDTLIFSQREVKTRDGQHFLMRTMPYRTADRVIDGVVITFTSVTEHKQVEAQLREQQNQYRLLFELSPQPAWIFDRESLSFLAFNKAALDQYQYPREEFMAMTLKDLTPERELPTILSYWDKVKRQRTDGATALMTKHRKRDGTAFDVRIIWRPVTFQGKAAILAVTYEPDPPQDFKTKQS